VSVLLGVVGCGAALLTALEDFARVKLKACMMAMIGTETGLAPREYFVLFSMGCTTTACVLTHLLCPGAAGSGVPEIKTMLSGVVKPSLLTVHALTAKFVGLVLSLAGGLSVGQEGPNVHVACALADVLMCRVPCFHAIAVSESRRLDVLGAACAAGVAASFGTPFGGAIFSIEITASTYNIAMLPQALWCAMAGALALEAAGLDKLTSIFHPDSTGSSLEKSSSYSSRNVFGDSTLIDLISFVGLGLLCGLLGCAFVVVVSSLARLRNDILSTQRLLFLKKLIMVAFGTCLVAPWVFEDLIFGLAGTRASFERTYYAESSAPTSKDEGDRSSDDVFEVLFQRSPMDDATRLKTFWFVPYKLFTTTVSVVLPLPVGVFKPTFTTGAAVGRALGELLHNVAARLVDDRWLESLNDGSGTSLFTGGYSDGLFTRFLPWEFAVIGAAAFAAGVTRALSSAVIFLELAGENHLRAPLLIATLVAHFIGNRFTKPIYDALIDTNGTPTLPDLPARCYYLPARAVMHPVLDASVFRDALKQQRRRTRPLVAEVSSASCTSQPEHCQLPASNDQAQFATPLCSNCDSKTPAEMTSLNSRTRSTAERFLRRFWFKPEALSNKWQKTFGTNESPVEGVQNSECEWSREDLEEDEPIPFLRLDSTYCEVWQLLHARTKLQYLRRLTSIPVVQGADQQALVGSVLFDDLASVVQAFENMLTLSRCEPTSVGNPHLRHTASLDIGAVEYDRLHHGNSPFSGKFSSEFEHSRAARETSRPGCTSRSPSEQIVHEISVNTCSPAIEQTTLLLGSSIQQNGAFCLFNDARRSSNANAQLEHRKAHFDVWQAAVRFVVNHDGRALPVTAADSNQGSPLDTQKKTSLSFARVPSISILLDVSPYQILDTMVLAKVDLIFRTLRVNYAHVTCSGVLVGVVTRARLRRVLAGDTPESTVWCKHLFCGAPTRSDTDEKECPLP